MNHKSKLIVGINDPVNPGKAILLGFQHILSMDLYVFPILLAGMLGLSSGDTSYVFFHLWYCYSDPDRAWN